MGANLGTESADKIVASAKSASYSLDRFSAALVTHSKSVECAGRCIGRGLTCLGYGIAIGCVSISVAVIFIQCHCKDIHWDTLYNWI